ncbi:phage tail tube protein [Niameybacter massiliensis]|uniref:phage tail tube protein n=1 Tax=Niameybacter massiliensis TaxID=1658108 RepID=UPI0006B661FC|nr:phage tail tube protein [Niameybacter massiliensis]
MKLDLQFFGGMAATGTKIGYGATSSGPHTEIPGLLEVPEIGGDPEKIDTTTLSDKVKTSVPGVKDLGDLTFKFLYDTETFKTLNAIKEKKSFKVTFPDNMTVTFDAIPSVKLGSAAVNGALTFSISMSIQSEPEFGTAS